MVLIVDARPRDIRVSIMVGRDSGHGWLYLTSNILERRPYVPASDTTPTYHRGAKMSQANSSLTRS
jgi:hypothetical protein